MQYIILALALCAHVQTLQAVPMPYNNHKGGTEPTKNNDRNNIPDQRIRYGDSTQGQAHNNAGESSAGNSYAPAAPPPAYQQYDPMEYPKVQVPA